MPSWSLVRRESSTTILRSSSGILSVRRRLIPFDLSLVAHNLYNIGIMPALLQEIVSVYPLLSPPNLTAHVSNRVCNALALLQCVASHSETRQLFLNGMSPHEWCFRVTTYVVVSSYPPLSLPLPQHDIKNTTLRIPSSYLARCHWGSCQGIQAATSSLLLLMAIRSKTTTTLSFISYSLLK